MSDKIYLPGHGWTRYKLERSSIGRWWSVWWWLCTWAHVDHTSCILHLPEAFPRQWGLGNVLKAMFKLFYESFARPDVHMKVGASEKFPMKFCWIKNEPVATQALLSLSVINAVKYNECMCKSSWSRNILIIWFLLNFFFIPFWLRYVTFVNLSVWSM